MNLVAACCRESHGYLKAPLSLPLCPSPFDAGGNLGNSEQLQAFQAPFTGCGRGSKLAEEEPEGTRLTSSDFSLSATQRRKAVFSSWSALVCEAQKVVGAGPDSGIFCCYVGGKNKTLLVSAHSQQPHWTVWRNYWNLTWAGIKKHY